MNPMNRAEFRLADTLAAGDTKNEIRVRLLDRDGTPVNLSAGAVTWSAEAGRKRFIHERAATAYTSGEVGIKLLPSDDIPKGPLYLVFRIDWGAAGVEFFPSHNNLILNIK